MNLNNNVYSSMKKQTLIVINALLFSVLFVSCNTTETVKDTDDQRTAVGEVNQYPVYYDELVDQYQKGSPGNDFSEQEIREFLPVYLDYLAKLEMAEDAGYYENKNVLEEYDVYSKQAAYAYWLENVIRPTLFDEYKSRYERMLKSSHILISVDENAEPSDTLEAYQTLLKAREEYADGRSMAELDAVYSTKRQGRSMGGDLPWFSVGTTVKEFEDVLYSLEPGELSMPFRTQFGYHIVLLEEEMDRKPDRYTSHIFLRADRSPAPLDTAIARLESGMNWDDVVKEFTMDTPSANNGGKIGWINYGSRYDPAFIDSVMSIDPEEPYSDVIRSTYGYHLLKIDSLRSFENDEMRDKFIMDQLESSNTFRKSNRFIVDWLDDTYTRRFNADLLKELTLEFETTDSVTFAEFESDLISESDTLYHFGDFVFSSADYLNYLKESGRGPLTSSYVRAWFSFFKEAMIDERLVDFTLDEHPSFSEQTDNYINGLVVYQINEDSVWSAATVDSTLLMKRFEEDRSSYQYPRRPYYHLISSSRDSSLNKAITFINEGNSPDSVRAAGIAVGVSKDSTASFSGEPFDLLDSMEAGSFSDIFEYKNRKAVFYLNDWLPERPMTFEEAFDRLLAEFQPEREEQWLMRLRDRYNVRIYPENLPQTSDDNEDPK